MEARALAWTWSNASIGGLDGVATAADQWLGTAHTAAAELLVSSRSSIDHIYSGIMQLLSAPPVFADGPRAFDAA